MKDPAFLFYFNEVSHDIFYLSRVERGCYLDLIIAQKKFGRLSLDLIKKILADDFSCWQNLKICFSYDKDTDTYYLEWLDESIKKRQQYSLSRSQNRKSKSSENPSKDTSSEGSFGKESFGLEKEHLEKSDLTKQPPQQLAISLVNTSNTSQSYENHMGNGIGIEIEKRNGNLTKIGDVIVGTLLSQDPQNHSDKNPSILFAIWGKPNPSLGEIQILEKLINEYSFEEVKRAFYISEEQGIKKLSYVKGILKKQQDSKIKAEKNKQVLHTYKPLPPEEKEKWKNFFNESFPQASLKKPSQ